MASIFEGSGEIDNLVPMDARINRGEYKIIEGRWKKALLEGKSVKVKIRPLYKGKSLRPAEFKINYTIDNKLYSDRLTNYTGGK
ncbi:DNA/RNA non-specific endonuclease [Heyndrickxia coagulans]|uniref:DNA/RNA non-specific endonuclease n=1 Tax=Heyndrickxia coagulans TaxID=1398 RepID=UPI001FCDABB8|nr:DNA/RNA non-specific endonuclease [Heyndrickxia coagulans]